MKIFVAEAMQILVFMKMLDNFADECLNFIDEKSVFKCDLADGRKFFSKIFSAFLIREAQ